MSVLISDLPTQTALSEIEYQLRRKALENRLREIRGQIDQLWHEKAEAEDKLDELETEEMETLQ